MSARLVTYIDYIWTVRREYAYHLMNFLYKSLYGCKHASVVALCKHCYLFKQKYYVPNKNFF